MDKKKIGMLAVGAGALYFLTRKSGPTFYDMQGRAIQGITCGGSATFDVPGYTNIWLSMLRNGVLSFDGPYVVPMPAYVYSCSNDVGAYEIAAYEIDANGVKGVLIGQTSFVVHPQQ